MNMHNAGGFIDHDPETGQPYAGIEVTTPGVALKLYLCDKSNAEAFRANFNKVIDTLIKTQPKLVVANGREAG